MAEIRASSDTAMSLSEQLANRSAELAVKPEQQSATLMHTASSMEEIGAGTKNNAEHTRLASERAGEATRCARKGGELMGEVATNMQSITDCARQMTEIIAMIDGIAFQTNILALTELETVTQSNGMVVEELARSSDILKNQVIDLQSRTQNFRIGDEPRKADVAPGAAVLKPAVAGSHDKDFWQSF